MRARCVHVVSSDNRAARRFQRSMSYNQPRHQVKGEALRREGFRSGRRERGPSTGIDTFVIPAEAGIHGP